MKNIEKIIIAARIEVYKWIMDARMIVIPMLAVFIYNFSINPLIINARIMGRKINVLEPLISVANSGLILLIIPIGFIVLISDFPRVDTSTIFIIARIGREKWAAAQIVRLFFMTLIYLTAILIASIIPTLPYAEFNTKWSRVVVDFATEYPEYSMNAGAKLIPENLYYQLTPIAAALSSFVYVFAYLNIIGLIMLLCTIIKRKTLGFVISSAIVVIGAAFYAAGTKLMWLFPMANSICWIHNTRFLRKQVVPTWFSVIYLLAALGLLAFFSIQKSKKINYDNILEITY